VPPALHAEEPPTPAPEEETATSSASAEQLPYGTGYEARQRAAQGGQQARSGQQTAAQDRTRPEAGVTPAENRSARRDVDRAAAQRDARREARERRGHHGGTGN